MSIRAGGNDSTRHTCFRIRSMGVYDESLVKRIRVSPKRRGGRWTHSERGLFQEIKEDNVEFRELVDNVRSHFDNVKDSQKNRPVETARLLAELRDELETYFALEEFYGYFKNAEVNNPSVCQQANQLRGEHEVLFLELNQIVDATEQIVYHECPAEHTFDSVAAEFENFLNHLQRHEHQEMELMMRLVNEEIGVGD